MATPNYGLLKDVKPTETPNIIGSFLAGKSMAQEEKMREQELQSKMLDAKMKQEEFEYRPQERAMKEAEHALGLQQTKAQIGQIGASTAAQYSQIAAAKLEQDQRRQQIARDQAEYTYKSVGSVLDAPPQLQNDYLRLAVKDARAQGLNLPKDMVMDVNNPETKKFLEIAKMKSYNALNAAKVQKELGSIPLVKTIDENGKPVYTRQDQAAGKAAYEPLPAAAITAQQNNFNDYVKEAEAGANSAAATIDLLDKFEEAASRIPLGTGPGRGAAAKLTAAGQEAIKASNQLVQQQIPLLKGSISDKDIEFLKESTLNVNNSIEANRDIKKVLKAVADRGLIRPQFIQSLAQQGITDPNLIRPLWNKFISENRVVNDEGHVIPGASANWKEYTTSEYVSDYQAGKAPKVKQNASAKQIETKAFKNIANDSIIRLKDGRRVRKVGNEYEFLE